MAVLLAAVMPSVSGETMDRINATLASLLPQEVQGWKAAGPDRVFDSQTIFDYLDGGGEVYRSYNFRLLLSRRYEKPGQPAIIADAFDMGTAGDAYGVFTHDLEGEPADIGQGAVYKAGLLSFWKGRFFISLYAEAETEETRRAVLDFGRQAAAAIAEQGEKPSIVALVPASFAAQGRLHYFHTHPILNYHFFVAAENILRLGEKTEAVLSVAGPKGRRSYFVVVRYPDAARADEAFRSFAQFLMLGVAEPAARQAADGTWTAGGSRKAYVIIIFKAGSRETAWEAIAEAERRIDSIVEQ
jgi:hypothetical protein